MSVIEVVALVLAGLTSLLVSILASRTPERLRIRNHRGASVPAAGGTALVLGALVGYAFGYRRGLEGKLLAAIALMLGFYLLGLVDDLRPSGVARGLIGHARAMLRGDVTGGAIKAVGGIGLALMVSTTIARGVTQVVLTAALIALCANLINILDTKPGRAGKAFLLAYAPIAVTSSAALGAAGPFLVATAVFLIFDLRERAMLGDSGSNPAGAMLGLGLATIMGSPGIAVAVIVLLGLNLMADRISLGAIIEKTPILRWLDSVGRPS